MSWMATVSLGGRSPFIIGGAISALAALACAVVLVRRGGMSSRYRMSGLRLLFANGRAATGASTRRAL
ncbi:hypothetical protein FPZ12_012970 [Amycolatopsis acidicola]|uniref:Uncharacterized protein n=1 Tax=Amycolatopsis acidicola TaxID=2596893 RepID=A0A5N0V5X4_9PSEU|nr:hypothetical protein FPZ12_012970 [Amycolatopsis acidicola]